VPLPVDRRSRCGARLMHKRASHAVAIIAASGSMVVIAASLGHRTLWNVSASVPRGLYAVMPDEPCRRGSLVSFRPPPGAAVIIYSRDYLPAGAGLIKQLVGLPGDRVCVRPAGLYVNGVRFGDVAVTDSRGRLLVPYRFCGAVAAGQAFVATTAHLSYDSRYFGPVPLSSLTPVLPVWTY
jgi:conjugative transfer signal peptidase TraF